MMVRRGKKIMLFFFFISFPAFFRRHSCFAKFEAAKFGEKEQRAVASDSERQRKKKKKVFFWFTLFFKGVCFVLSGLENPERSQIRDAGIAMGAS
jgi:hypothetical protein